MDLSVVLPPTGTPVPGGITIDDAPGPERLFVVLSPVALPATKVAAAARANADSLAAVSSIDGISVSSAWLVHPKQTERSR
jgi:hypothetical protein